MDIYYLKDHMCEELDGAKEYLKQASNLKGVNNDWSKNFYDMGKMELEHAAMLYKMLDQHYRELDSKPELSGYMQPFKDEIDEKYMEKAGAARALMDVYSR